MKRRFLQIHRKRLFTSHVTQFDFSLVDEAFREAAINHAIYGVVK